MAAATVVPAQPKQAVTAQLLFGRLSISAAVRHGA